MFMRAVVIEHEMNVQFQFDRSVDFIQESRTPDDGVWADTGRSRSFKDIQRGDSVVVPCRCNRELAVPEGRAATEESLCPVQSLNLTFHPHSTRRFVRGFRYRPNDVAHFADELRIVAEFEVLDRAAAVCASSNSLHGCRLTFWLAAMLRMLQCVASFGVV